MKREFKYQQKITSENQRSRCPLCGGNIENIKVTKNIQERRKPEISEEWCCTDCGTIFSADFRIYNNSIDVIQREAFVEYEKEEIRPFGEMQTRRW